MRKRAKNPAKIAVMSNVSNFKPHSLHQEQHAMVIFHYLFFKKKETPTQMYEAMKEAYGMVGELIVEKIIF